MTLASASPRQIAVLRIFEGNDGALTEEEFRQIDQRPCRGLGRRDLIARVSRNRFVLKPAGRDLLMTYEALEVYRRVKEAPLSALFQDWDRRLRVMPGRAANGGRRHHAA